MNAKFEHAHDVFLSLKELDESRRAREIASYRRAPSQPMPIVFKVRENGGKIAWPKSFK